MPSFKIGINMAGAVSAGAYTAGVLDFLTEALDEWYKAKANGEAVPMHDVSLEVFTGASAGGMCAAISSVLLQQDFQHIPETSMVDENGKIIFDKDDKPVPLVNTNNLLYESWVNRIDIRPLLAIDDLKDDRPVVSLLNSRIIQQIAEYAIDSPTNLKSPVRPWVSPNLALFLALTNLRGIPYSLNATAPGSVEETTFFYGARVGFQTVRNGPPGILQDGLLKNFAHALDLEKPAAAGGWDFLQTAAMATGAFPLFLQPRVLQRYTSEFIPPHWLSVMPPQNPCSGLPCLQPPAPAPLHPSFPAGFAQPFPTLNVDGGITNNDPYNYAHDYLAALDPRTGNVNPRSPLQADRAVINIAPFPTVEAFNPCFDVEIKSTVLSALSGLLSALISQSRFYGESLGNIMDGTTFSRFIIAPSDNKLVDEYRGRRDQPPALQCASLGAFGGFLEREFRAHDFKLGRRNCQKFLMGSFVLPVENPIIDAGLPPSNSADRKKVVADYRCNPPGDYAQDNARKHAPGSDPMDAPRIAIPEMQANAGRDWLPIIPLLGTAKAPLKEVTRAQISRRDLGQIVKLARKRYGALAYKFIDLIPDPLFQFFLAVGQFPISLWIASLMKNYLIKSLGEACGPEK